MPRWAKQSKGELVLIAVNVSWPGRIESRFAQLGEHVVANTYYQSRGQVSQAIDEQIAWRNWEAPSWKDGAKQPAC